MLDYYNSEIEGMVDFYKTLNINVDYECNTDGAVNGCLVEFKLSFQKLSTHKNQVIRYLQAFNAVAKKIPSKVLLIDINGHLYINGDVITSDKGVQVKWTNNTKHWGTPHELVEYFELNDYCKGWINEESIVSYNNLFCIKNNRKITSKEEVRDELINPTILDVHNFDWYGQINKEKSHTGGNDWLTFNMNMLGSISLKKQLGAFFTPDKYVKISTEYVRKAIKNVPKGMDYVVIDRCAGSGNLEKFFTGEELKHFILNTIDYTEWTTLNGLYKGRVRHIIPHTSLTRNNLNGLMSDGDALQEDFYNKLRPLIKDKYVIMLENPPFAGTSGIRGGAKGTLKNKSYSYINLEMKKNGYNGNVCKDLLAQFVWSAFEMIKCDEYILYGPIMWWKSNHIVDKEFIDGHMCNKRLFNTKDRSGILLGHWKNNNIQNDSLECNIDNSNLKYTIKKKYTFISALLNNYKVAIDKGNLRTAEEDEIGLLFSTSSTLDGLNGGIYNRETYRTELVTSAGLKLSKVTQNNVRELSVIQCVNCYSPQEYYLKEVLMKCSDMGNSFIKDTQLLDDCFLYTLLSDKTKCISNKQIQNHLCLLQNTKADNVLTEQQKESVLIKLWQAVLDEAKDKTEYNPEYFYGLKQIVDDINIRIPSGTLNKKGKIKYKKKYLLLDEKIDALKLALNSFFKTNILPKLFKYELIK